MSRINLESHIRSIPDFPKQGILFRDITTLLKDPEAFRASVDEMVRKYKKKKINLVVAVESRGFIFGSALAYKLGAGFVPVRKKGKLPSETISATYELEYGTDTLEIHKDAITPGAKVLIVDDLLATGGTMKAVTELVRQLRGKIFGIVCLVELVDLKGRQNLRVHSVHSLIKFHGK
ncbi:MAG: adenine phosphoribosyltransferase [Candidatus Omnitrophica bacterium]|nr:adenine phosphoribosyltransferase [Candidatus Omnitrophota bacterium]